MPKLFSFTLKAGSVIGTLTGLKPCQAEGSCLVSIARTVTATDIGQCLNIFTSSMKPLKKTELDLSNSSS